MSENTVDITFKIKNDKSELAEKLLSEFSMSSKLVLSSKSFRRGKYAASFESLDLEPEFFDALEKLYHSLKGIGAENTIAELYFEQVGESDFYKMYNQELKVFSSLKDIKKYEDELNSQVDLSKLNFSKGSIEDTVLARFHCPSKVKRSALASIFNHLLSLNTTERQTSFSETSKTLLKSTKYREVKWCEYRVLEGDSGLPSSPWRKGIPELIESIDFISEQGDYIFVGFDASHIKFLQYCTDNVPHENGYRWPSESFESTVVDMTDILTFIDGVKELTMKFRLNKFPNEEYITKSGINFRSQHQSKDDCWVLPDSLTDQNGKPFSGDNPPKFN